MKLPQIRKKRVNQSIYTLFLSVTVYDLKKVISNRNAMLERYVPEAGDRLNALC